jgi:hypothetical protein
VGDLTNYKKKLANSTTYINKVPSPTHVG